MTEPYPYSPVKNTNISGDFAVARMRQLFEVYDIPFTSDNIQQALVMLKALQVYEGRTRAYGQVWKQYGALSNLLNVARKVDRLMSIWWHRKATDRPLHKDCLDDAIDGLNYMAFFVRLAAEGNATGSSPERPDGAA